LAVLHDSLFVQTEAEMCSVLMHLQQCMEALERAGVSWEPSSSCRTVDSLSHDVDAILQLPCSCMQEGPAQLQGPQHNPVHASAGQESWSGRPAHAEPTLKVLQDSLLLAFRHFSSSVAVVLACSQPQDSLALAAEKAACCAAGLALVTAQGGCCDASPIGHAQGPVATVVAAQQGIGVQGSVSSCCRCSAVWHVVADMLQDAVGVVAVHLGVLA
jgi:hypothetical protein